MRAEDAYQKVVADLEARGHPSYWVTSTVDVTHPHAIFLKDGKPWYKSPCPHYQGYWLHGGGSVQCAASDKVLPGIHHQLFCASNCHECEYNNIAHQEEA